MTIIDMTSLSYPDFVAAIGQENTPPGGAATVAQWRRWASELGRESSGDPMEVLDLACSTGFSGRTFISNEPGIRVTGIDLSSQAIDVAASKADGDSRLTYVCTNATQLPVADASVDVVLGGCNFAFIADRERALVEVLRALRTGGLLMVANFFYRRQPPQALLEEVGRTVGFTPSSDWTLAYWRHFFSQGFALERDQIADLHPERKLPIAWYAVGSALLADAVPLTMTQRRLAAQRMYQTRSILNRHRDYQGLAVEVWRKI